MAKRRPPSDESGYSWMDTYGDMVTLLLTFFVLLYAMSTVNESKWEKIVLAFTGSPPTKSVTALDMLSAPNFSDISPANSAFPADAFIGAKTDEITNAEGEGGTMATSVVSPSLFASESESQSNNAQVSEELAELMNSEEYQQVEKDFSQLYEKLVIYVKTNGLEDMLFIDRDLESVYVRVTAGVLFDSGEAVIIDEAKPMLDELENMLSDAASSIATISVEGHTDNRPIHNYLYADNWDLSTKRAANVVRYLAQKGNIPPEYFTIMGYGEYHPIATNETEEGRQQNRRVQFVLKKKILTIEDIRK